MHLMCYRSAFTRATEYVRNPTQHYSVLKVRWNLPWSYRLTISQFGEDLFFLVREKPEMPDVPHAKVRLRTQPACAVA